MRSVRNDKQLFVLRTRIRSDHGFVAVCFAVHHVMVHRFAEITAVGVLAVHDQNRRTDLVDIIQETAVGISLRADDTPTVIRVTATRMVATGGLVVIVVVLDELPAVHRPAVGLSRLLP